MSDLQIRTYKNVYIIVNLGKVTRAKTYFRHL